MTALWTRCVCGALGWRYLTAAGSGWRCWCGAHRPDQSDLTEARVVEMPAQLELFDLEETA